MDATLTPMLPHVHLIRHGATEWSRDGRHTSRTDVALTAEGEAQARELRPRLQPISFTRVLSSPRRRALQTCALAGLGETPEIEDNLREWDYGDFEGLRSGEILMRHPQWNLFHDGCPHGESPADVALRADRVIAQLLTSGGEIAVFSHGHFLRVMATRWIQLPVAIAQRLYLDTGSISSLGFEHERREEPVIQTWNERALTILKAPAPHDP